MILQRYQWMIMGFGLLLAFLAFLVDPLGLSSPGFSRGQFLLLGLGLLIIVGGIIGKRLPTFYQGGALLLLNTLVLLVFIEIAAGVYTSLSTEASPETPPVVITEKWQIDYYDRQPWTRHFIGEFNRLTTEYETFTLWRHSPHTGDHINIDEQGARVVPGTNCEPGAYLVMTFGGSAMWGWGAPDWGTIPAYLHTHLTDQLERPVCIQNYGEIAYVSTQEILSLMKQLQTGHIPDLVIFYTGNNDTVLAFRSGRADTHYDYLNIQARLEGDTPTQSPLSLANLANYSYALNLIEDWAVEAQTEQPEQLADTLVTLAQADYPVVAEQVAQNYAANYQLVAALGEAYGFDYAFFLQPTIIVSGKTMTPAEAERQQNPEFQGGLPEFMTLTYDAIMALDQPYIYDFRGVIDDMEQQVWVDLSHVTPEGNEVIAAQMSEILEPTISD